MTRIYVCRRCKKKFSVQEFKQNRFCCDCGTYLSARFASSSSIPRCTFALKKVTENKHSEDRCLPKGYEVRKEQVKFIEEATKALESKKVFVGRALAELANLSLHSLAFYLSWKIISSSLASEQGANCKSSSKN